MLLNRIKKDSVFYISILTVCVLFMAQPSAADDDLEQLSEEMKTSLRTLGIPQSEESNNNEQNLSKAIQAFGQALVSDDEETKEVVRQWDDYIVSVTDFTNDEHIAAIGAQKRAYLKALKDLNDRISEIDAVEKQYTSAWIDDLKIRFGREFIIKNRRTILDNFGAIIAGSYHQYEEQLKNVIYAEEMLFGSYKKYFNLFLDFYNKEASYYGRRILDSRKQAAEAVLALINDVSYVGFYKTYALKENLAGNRAQKLNKELYLFFKGHEIYRNFDLSKACKDLNEAVGYTDALK
jgi:hypothetical protein